VNGLSKLIHLWFADDERAMATSIATLSLPIGCIMGLVIGPFFISEMDKLKPEQGKRHAENYCLVSAIIVTFLSFWLIFFF
jgi:sugar phosphate permease